MISRGEARRRRAAMPGWSRRRRARTAGRMPGAARLGGLGGRARAGLETRDELVEPELLEAVRNRVELARAELDEALALLDQLERLPQAGLARVGG
jgi:hypothetical protein